MNDIREGGLTAKTDNDMCVSYPYLSRLIANQQADRELNADETDSGSAKPNVDAFFGTRSGSPTPDGYVIVIKTICCC